MKQKYLPSIWSIFTPQLKALDSILPEGIKSCKQYILLIILKQYTVDYIITDILKHGIWKLRSKCRCFASCQKTITFLDWLFRFCITTLHHQEMVFYLSYIQNCSLLSHFKVTKIWKANLYICFNFMSTSQMLY